MDPETAKGFVDALGAPSGIVAVVGAGGKKSTLYRLFEAHQAIGTRRILLTSTVQIATAPKALDIETLIIDGDAEAAIARARTRDDAWLITGPPKKPGRFSGLPDDVIPHLHGEGAFALSLVKADGARMRMIKAPGADEPALPAGVSTLLPIVSARAFGRPLDQRLVHRPERLAAVVDAEAGTLLTPGHIARLLSSPDGSLCRAGSAHVVPVINMVEGAERLAAAREAARRALSMTECFDHVVLASMTSPSPLIDVITR